MWFCFVLVLVGFFSQKKLYLSNFCLGRIVIVGVIVLALCYLLCYSQFPGWQHWLCYTETDQTRAANSGGMWYFSPLPVDWINVIETAEDRRFVDAISDYFMENINRKAREGNTRAVLILRMPKTWLGTLWVKSKGVTATNNILRLNIPAGEMQIQKIPAGYS